MKETILNYTRGEITYKVCVFPGVFTKLVRSKIKFEHLEYYEAILSVLQDIIKSLTCVDNFTFEYIDNKGYKHTISGNNDNKTNQQIKNSNNNKNQKRNGKNRKKH